ncbi:hypothetical protein B296_00037815, partial [Ensete ventricosum]
SSPSSPEQKSFPEDFVSFERIPNPFLIPSRSNLLQSLLLLFAGWTERSGCLKLHFRKILVSDLVDPRIGDCV